MKIEKPELEISADPLTERVIGAAIEVHRELGPGFLESVYEDALSYELTLRGVPFQRQVQIDVRYKDQIIKGQRLDLLVDEELVVEIKAVARHEDAFTAQVLSYLRGAHLPTGLLLNFGFPTMKQGIKRLASRQKEETP